MGSALRAICYALPLLSLSELSLTAIASADPMGDLIAAAKREGQLTVIALPRDWCGYGGIIDRFEGKYGLVVNEVQPDAGSAQEIEAIKAGRDKADPDTPDVIDVGMSYASSAQAEGLLEPYKVSTWETIPEAAKDAQGYWYGGYYGVLGFEVNADLVKTIPRDWADLLDPEYRNSISLAGSISSNQAVQSVFAAGLSSAKGDIEKAADEGLKFFANLHANGNFVPVIGDSRQLTKGVTPIVIRWHYLGLGDQDRLEGTTKVEVVTPRTGVVAGVYVQAVSAFAPHPNAARLWMEYLFSDEAQLAWLAGHCHPIRIADLRRRGTIPLEKFDGAQPLDPDDYQDVDPVFPTLKEQERARDIITNGWDAVVGVEIRCVPQEDEQIPMSFNDTTTCEAPVLQ
jgi:putative spermidine/putrescine transport system substrate-binding protein